MSLLDELVLPDFGPGFWGPIGRSSSYSPARFAVLYREQLQRLAAGRDDAKAGRALRLLGRAAEARERLAHVSSAAGVAWRGELRRSAADLDAAIRLEPRRSRWKLWRALLGRQIEGWDVARTLRALDDADAPLAAAELLASEQRWREALPRLEEAVRREPREGWILHRRALARRRLGDRAGWLSDCERALLLDEGSGYFEQAQREDREERACWALVARGNARRSPGSSDFSGGLEDLEAAVRASPRAAYAWAYLGRARLQAGRADEALEAAGRAASLAPRCGWIRVWRGEALRRLGRVEQAERELDAGLRLDPEYEFGYAWRGGARRALGRPAEALRDLETACGLDPSYAWAWHEKSLTLRALGRVEDALAALGEAARLDPKHAWAASARGAREAAAELERFLRARPSHAWALAWRGEARLKLGEPALAKRDLEKAARLAPGEAWPRAWLGRALWLLGDRAGARRALEAAARLDPRYANARAWLGRLLHEAGSGARARRELAAAARLDPRSAWILCWLGDAELAAGRWTEAEAAFRQALELDRGGTRAREGLEAARRRARGTLVLCGLGDEPARTATLDALVALSECAAVYSGPGAEAAARRYCGARAKAGGAGSALAAARRGETVGLALRGQPWLAGGPGETLLRRCARERVAVRLLTGPSEAGLALAREGLTLGVDALEAE